MNEGARFERVEPFSETEMLPSKQQIILQNAVQQNLRAAQLFVRSRKPREAVKGNCIFCLQEIFADVSAKFMFKAEDG